MRNFILLFHNNCLDNKSVWGLNTTGSRNGPWYICCEQTEYSRWFANFHLANRDPKLIWTGFDRQELERWMGEPNCEGLVRKLQTHGGNQRWNVRNPTTQRMWGTLVGRADALKYSMISVNLLVYVPSVLRVIFIQKTWKNTAILRTSHAERRK